MKIDNIANLKIDTIHQIGNGSCSISYKCENGIVLKKFINNDEYKKLCEWHNNDFMGYLIELSKDDSELLSLPLELYINNLEQVSCYTKKYEAGTTLDKMYPKTNIIHFLESLKDFYSKLDELDYISLYDMHYQNIMYTGKIKIIDADYGKFINNSSKDNRRRMNDAILKGLFGFKMTDEIETIPELSSNLTKVLIGEESVDVFIKEYIRLLEEKYGKVLYKRHLINDFIKVK